MLLRSTGPTEDVARTARKIELPPDQSFLLAIRPTAMSTYVEGPERNPPVHKSPGRYRVLSSFQKRGVAKWTCAPMIVVFLGLDESFWP
jgi:hypothetical protein